MSVNYEPYLMSRGKSATVEKMRVRVNSFDFGAAERRDVLNVLEFS
jgi:hypothetical protein